VIGGRGLVESAEGPAALDVVVFVAGEGVKGSCVMSGKLEGSVEKFEDWN
jgi:hypothetical protein